MTDWEDREVLRLIANLDQTRSEVRAALDRFDGDDLVELFRDLMAGRLSALDERTALLVGMLAALAIYDLRQPQIEPEEDQPMIRCYFCRTAVADLEAAIDADWIPSFYDGDREVCEPVCPSCTAGRLQFSDDGEYELAEHTRYAGEAESAQRAGAWPQAAALWQMAAEKCRDAQRRAYYEKQARWSRDMQDLTGDTNQKEN